MDIGSLWRHRDEKDPKTHEKWETIEWNSLKKVKIFWILYLDDSSRQKDI